MYKNLNATVLGVSGRQSELIELAMTYGFRGLDIDIVDLVKRTQRSEFDKASRYLLSSKMQVSGFDVPIDLDTDDASFEKSLALLHGTIEIAGKVGARAGFLRLPAATDRLPFHEYFDVLRKRVDRIGEVFEKNNVQLGLYFSVAQESRESRQFKFIQDVEGFLAFFKACTSSSVSLVIDTFNWVVGGGTFDQLATIPGSKIAALRISDTETMPSIADASLKMRQMPAEAGIIDNVRFVATLSKSGFDGPITAFAHASNFAGFTRDSIVAKAQDALDHVLAGAGLPTFTRRPDMIVEATGPISEDIGLEA
ncbi:sugar phosphate isomerase/epimerase family protein [Pirellulaceae bacterium SH501]